MKRSELERISTGEDPDEEKVTTPTPSTSVLRSPTSMTPVDDSPIFSIPKSEVCTRLRGCHTLYFPSNLKLSFLSSNSCLYM